MEGFNDEVVKTLSEVLRDKYGLATITEIDKAVAALAAKVEKREAKGNRFSLSTMIRGLRAIKGEALNIQTAESDINYVKALSTGATPGSYLVPTIQADEIIEYLANAGVARSMGARIWPMAGIQKMAVPSATATPTWEWLGQNTAQTASDPNLGQMTFDLKERRALVAVPNQLLAVSVPAFDTLLAELLGVSAAEHEDTAMFSASTVSGGPTAMMAASSTSAVNCAGSANGGNLTYNVDILAVLAKASAVKAKGPFVWVMSPRTYYQRILGLIDLSSRPLVIPTLTAGLQQPSGATPIAQQVAAGYLMGYPVFVTPAIPENEALGSGSNQSHIVFTNPRYVHIAQDGNVEIATSTERYFEVNQTAVRAVNHEDFGYAPPAGIVLLKGVN